MDEKVTPKLTRKQRAFVDFIKANPKKSATEAAMQSYDAKNRRVAENIATENMRKPAIQAILREADAQAQESIISIMNTSTELRKDSRHAEVALKAAQDIQNRLHGMPKQQLDIQSQVLNITLDLTGGSSGPVPQEILDQLN